MPKRPKDETLLILSVATGSSIKRAAAEAGFAERTAYRRLQSPEGRRRVAAARDEIWQRAVGKLAEGAAEAVATLRELLDCESPAVRLGAARAMLAVAPSLRDAVENSQRLTELEHKFNESDE